MTMSAPQARDLAYLVHPQTNLDLIGQTGPIVITGGDGIYSIDDSGNRYLEGLSGLWCSSLGLSEKRLADAAYKQMLALPFYHSFNGMANLPSIDLAEKLIGMAPVPMSKVLLQGSGSEANDTAIKLVWYYHNAIGRPAKKKIIGRKRGYHGNTIATVSLSGQPANYMDFDLPLSIFLHTENPHYYRLHEDGETEADFATRMADALEALILQEGPETIGAFFAEPILNASGIIIPVATYWPKMQAILKKYEILFIVDEVICGFGRTGKMWGLENYGLQPDMISCAKALSASYQPVSALLISEKIHQAMVAESAKLGNFSHGYTYAGHPVACAVALEALTIYQERDILGHIAKVASGFQAGGASFADHPMVGDVKGIGLLCGIELMADKRNRTPFPEAAKVGRMVQDACRSVGLMNRALGDRIVFAPPLIIEEHQVAELWAKFSKGLDMVWRMVKADGLLTDA